MDSVRAARIMLQRQPLSEILPYLAYDKDKGLYMLDSGVGFCFECSPVQFPRDDITSSMRGLFESFFPSGTSIQFTLFSSKKINPFLDSYVLARENTYGDSIYTNLARKKRDFILGGTEKSLFKGFDLKVRDFRLIVSVVVPCLRTPSSYQRYTKDVVPPIKETTFQALNSASLNPVNLTPERLINVLVEALNPGHPADSTLYYDQRIPLKDQFIYSDTEILVEKQCLRIDGKYCKSFTVKQYPQEWDISRGINFCGDLYENVRQIGVPFFLSLNCQYPDVSKIRRDIQKKAMIAGYQAFGPLAKWFPKLGMKKENFDMFSLALENGEMPFYGFLNLFFYAENAKEAHNAAGICNSLFRSMGFILQEDTYIMLPMFIQSLPMGYATDAQKDLRRRKTFTTANISELIPVQADWKGTGRPILPLISRRGQIQFFDIFSNRKGGYSSVIVASTGAGKSFFVNELIVSYLGVGAKIWTIDVGRSYEKLCNFLGGDFLVFSPSSGICVNPFSRIVDINEEMPILKSILAQMVSREPLDNLGLVYLEKAIKNSYAAKGNAMTVTDVADYLTAGADKRRVDLGKRLFPYTASGAYASFFEGECTLLPKQNFVVLELEELRSKKDLQEVVLLALIYQIQQEMMNRKQNKLVIIDEAWDLLTGGNTTAFMETGYRRFRKYHGACVSITQSMNDFYRIPAGQAIIENSDYMFLLRQRPESIEAMKKSQKVALSEGLYELLKSVHTDAGNYSEIFMYTPEGITVSRLVVDRFTQLLYTSKAEEFGEIKRYTDRGISILDAINEIIKKEEKSNINI